MKKEWHDARIAITRGIARGKHHHGVSRLSVRGGVVLDLIGAEVVVIRAAVPVVTPGVKSDVVCLRLATRNVPSTLAGLGAIGSIASPD
jgi:hypothetical protein